MSTSVDTPKPELWRVFVLLRDRHGIYERAVRASGPLAAEDNASKDDRHVLATLGSRLVRADAARLERIGGYRGPCPLRHPLAHAGSRP
jgi:hypothetical protein